MIVKNIIDEDFTNYKECAMFIGFPHCTFKCEKDCGCIGMCQNMALTKSPDINVTNDSVIRRYIHNPLTRAIVFGGLEPFDDFADLYSFITDLRQYTQDTVVIYTGYNKDELLIQLNDLSKFNNIIVKFGRFVPNQEKHYDPILGVYLASDNQYAEVIS